MRVLRYLFLAASSTVVFGQAANPFPASRMSAIVPFGDGPPVILSGVAQPWDMVRGTGQALKLEAGPLMGTMFARRDGTCYTLRSYRFKRDAQSMDATSFAGSTTCQPSGTIHERSAGGSSSH